MSLNSRDYVDTVVFMTVKMRHGASGALRRFAGWVARGSVGYPLLEGINYWDELKESPSQMETLFAVFANVLELDEAGEVVNEKYAEKRAATCGSIATAQAHYFRASRTWSLGK